MKTLKALGEHIYIYIYIYIAKTLLLQRKEAKVI